MPIAMRASTFIRHSGFRHLNDLLPIRVHSWLKQ